MPHKTNIGRLNKKAIYQLAADWQAAGVQEGDMLLVHSSIRRILRRLVKMEAAASPSMVLESFLLALGKSGTLLLPLFNFDFTKSIAFDIRNTPSHMGILTEAGRFWPGAIRTGHPIYSFAVIGKDAKVFHGLKNFSGYGADSPFGILHRLGGKIAVLDLPDQNSMTFYHYVEETLNANYRYHKIFTGQYIDEEGHESTQNFSLFVRNIEQGVVTRVEAMGEILWEKGIYTGSRPNQDCGLRVIRTTKLFDEVATILDQGLAKGILYDIEQ